MKPAQKYLYYCPYCPFASDFKGDMGMHLAVMHNKNQNDFDLHPHPSCNDPYDGWVMGEVME